MRVLVLPYIPEFHIINNIVNAIDNDNTLPAVTEKKRDKRATKSYSKQNNKFVFHENAEVTLQDLENHSFESIGNNVTCCEINGKLVTFMVFQSGADLSKPTLDKIDSIIANERAKL